MPGDASLERVHGLAAVVGDAVGAVEVHLAVVRPVGVAEDDACLVKLGVAMVALVSRQFTQHATRPVLPRHVCKKQNTIDVNLFTSGEYSGKSIHSLLFEGLLSLALLLLKINITIYPDSFLSVLLWG